MGCRALVHQGSRCELHGHLNTGRFADRARGTRQQRGYGAAWDKQRKRILARDGGLCQPCRRSGTVEQATEVDHVLARAEGGNDQDDNLQAICKRCHQAKTALEATRGRSKP